MSFAIPAGEQPPVVIEMALDLGVIDGISPDQLFQHIPAAFFKFIGLGATAHMLGGFMAGIWMFDAEVDPDAWEGANQGAFICAIDISRFRDLESFKQEVDRHQKGIQKMTPAPGYHQANLPGRWNTNGNKSGRRSEFPLALSINQSSMRLPTS